MIAYLILGALFAYFLTIFPTSGSPAPAHSCTCHKRRFSDLFVELLATGAVFIIALLCTGILSSNALTVFLGYAIVRSLRASYLALSGR